MDTLIDHLEAPPEAFPPGEYIADELKARGWSQKDLVDIIGRDANLIAQIIAGRRSITPETARAIGAAFGTSAEVWLNLESRYQIWRAYEGDKNATPEAISRKARMYGYAPIGELLKRTWIEPTDDIDLLEQRVLAFYGVPSLDVEPSLNLKVAAKMAGSYKEGFTRAQISWFCRAKRLSRAVQAAPFDHASFVQGLKAIVRMAADADNIRVIPKTLAGLGVRLVIVEQIAGSLTDGATIWTDSGPVIALSLRFDRIDAFWHTLGHELMHIKFEDGDSLDVALVADASGRRPSDESIPDYEKRANEQGAQMLIPAGDLQSFAHRFKRRISEELILQFANQVSMHPGVIVGQLQYRGALPWTHLRKFLMQGQIRKMIAGSTVVDGWGTSPGVF